MKKKNWEEIKNDFENWKYQKEVKLKRKTEDALRWIANNRDALIVAIPTVIGVGKFVDKNVQRISRRNTVKREEKIRNRSIWDPKLGFWHKCKRDLTEKDKLEIEIRMNRGESIGNILRSMKLI